MKADIRKQWTDALRSGKFTQATGLLHHKDNDGKESFCCLGVLCKIAADAGVVMAEEKPDVFDNTRCFVYGTVDGAKNDAVLPTAVQEWAGIDSPDPILLLKPETQEEFSASGMNDTLCSSFDEIANAIEKVL